MNVKNQLSEKLRHLMRQDSHGMTVAGLAELVKAETNSVRRSLKLMPDTYISEWVLNGENGRFTSVWKIVTPPADAPEPDENHPRFKPINPNWMTDLRKNNGWKNRLLANERKKAVKAVKAVNDDAKASSKSSGPKLTRWVPVKPWPKGERP